MKGSGLVQGKFEQDKRKDVLREMGDRDPTLLGATEIKPGTTKAQFNTTLEGLRPRSKGREEKTPVMARNDPKTGVQEPLPVLSPEEAQAEIDDLEQMFSGEGQTESSILKELFNSKNIKVKTELTGDQVSIVSRLFLMADITKRPYLRTVLNEFITLQVSKDRKSRMEFVEAHRDRQQNAQNGLLNGLFGRQQQ